MRITNNISDIILGIKRHPSMIRIRGHSRLWVRRPGDAALEFACSGWERATDTRPVVVGKPALRRGYQSVCGGLFWQWARMDEALIGRRLAWWTSTATWARRSASTAAATTRG
jgi:hypothetical protein